MLNQSINQSINPVKNLIIHSSVTKVSEGDCGLVLLVPSYSMLFKQIIASDNSQCSFEENPKSQRLFGDSIES